MATCPTCGADRWADSLDGLIRTFCDEVHAALDAAGVPYPDESPLRWERPSIVSTRASTAAGTPKPNGWEQ